MAIDQLVAWYSQMEEPIRLIDIELLCMDSGCTSYIIAYFAKVQTYHLLEFRSETYLDRSGLYYYDQICKNRCARLLAFPLKPISTVEGGSYDLQASRSVG